MTVSDPEPHRNTDPDPASTPDLEQGGGVSPGSTPPESGQTSGLSAPEPETRNHFPVSGWVALVSIAVIVAIFVAVIVAVLL
ncbi:MULTISPECIES: DUF6480 family protein [unclassified Rhodococcus (in: high G+C Gram-positive bacteria)]|uniref:DUF6480 family protein n=1 Tax=unclassified Rhodococcus (in: high G+C Gram-positive bacteria) TaxID=192944 RepID=UPI00146EB572|nr:hypothetical protein [Rhodococcus sp. BL-253-APC-6A1W]NME77678.1 hypothetical protein [Rhodococcus sp. 105337]